MVYRERPRKGLLRSHDLLLRSPRKNVLEIDFKMLKQATNNPVQSSYLMVQSTDTKPGRKIWAQPLLILKLLLKLLFPNPIRVRQNR